MNGEERRIQSDSAKKKRAQVALPSIWLTIESHEETSSTYEEERSVQFKSAIDDFFLLCTLFFHKSHRLRRPANHLPHTVVSALK